MTTAFSVITAAVVDALQAAPAVCDLVFRARERVLTEDTAAAVNVQFDGADPDIGAIHGAPVDWKSRIAVSCYARSTTQGGDQAVDGLLQAVYARLAADTTLGGLVDDIGVPMIEAEYDAGAQKTGWVRMTYIVSHRTQDGTLAA